MVRNRTDDVGGLSEMAGPGESPIPEVIDFGGGGGGRETVTLDLRVDASSIIAVDRVPSSVPWGGGNHRLVLAEEVAGIPAGTVFNFREEVG